MNQSFPLRRQFPPWLIAPHQPSFQRLFCDIDPIKKEYPRHEVFDDRCPHHHCSYRHGSSDGKFRDRRTSHICSTHCRSYIIIREAGLFDVSPPSYRILRQSRNSIGRLAYFKIRNGPDRDEDKWSRQTFHRFYSERNREVEIPLDTRASSTTNDWFDPFQGRKSSSASRPPASEGIVPVDCML